MQKLYERIALGLGRVRELFEREDGQGAVEYALVVLGIALIISAAVAGFANEITNFMSAAGAKLQDYIP
jgi:Flp pilus assembly pilin Flp